MQRRSACATSIRAAKANTEGRVLFRYNTPKGLTARTNRLPPGQMRCERSVALVENSARRTGDLGGRAPDPGDGLLEPRDCNDAIEFV